MPAGDLSSLPTVTGMEADAEQQSVRRLSEFKESPEGINALRAIELAGTGELAPTAEMILDLLVSRGIGMGLEIGAELMVPVTEMIKLLRDEIKEVVAVPDPEPLKDTFSAPELGERWGKSAKTIRLWIQEGKLPFVFKVGVEWMARRDDVVKFENRKKLKPVKHA